MKMSRPRLSTPNHATLLGPRSGTLISLVKSWLRSFGPRWTMNFENAGAVNARVIRIRTTTAAPTAILSRLKRVQKSCHGVRPSTFSGAPSSGTRTSIAGSVCWTWLTRRYPCSRPPKCRAERIRGQHKNERPGPGYPAAPGISPEERDESGHDLDPPEEAERAFGAVSLAEGRRAV